MKHPISQTLYAYWNEVRKDRPAPRRFEIEPAHFASILPHTFILERIDSETFRYRLAGTALAQMFGCELRDANFLHNFEPGYRETVERLLATVTLHCGAGVLTNTAAAADGRVIGFEVVLLPLVHTRGGVDRVVGAVSPAQDIDWQESEGLSSWTLQDSQVIWPDGHPQPMPDPVGSQEPFLPHIRRARIVRSERRQFRVYDGGLCAPLKS